jgi:EpsD family peptidyl-prolyl cis-trans isomerase
MKNVVKWNLLIGLALLSACHKQATGQVAAVVNGDEITLQEINSELQGARIPAGVDGKLAQQEALQRIIDRHLLAQQARKDGLDKTPEYLMRERQMRDALLIQLMEASAARATDVPSQKAIDDYIKANPATFADRTIYTLDRIQFPTPADTSRLKVLYDAHSMDAVAAALNQLGIKFARGPARMDSAQIGQEIINRIKSLPSTEPFILPVNGLVTVAVITGEAKQPITGDQATPLAVEAIRKKSVMDAVQQRLKTARADAKIQYQAGFAPPKPAPAGHKS